MNEIDTGDTVLHGPTGETWVVAYVDGDRMAWCGWPPGEAMLSDCKLIEKATPEYRDKLLHDMAKMRLDPEGYDRRKSYATKNRVIPMGEILYFPDRNLLKLIDAVNGFLDGSEEPSKALVLAEMVMRDCGAVQEEDGKWRLPDHPSGD